MAEDERSNRATIYTNIVSRKNSNYKMIMRTKMITSIILTYRNKLRLNKQRTAAETI